MKKKNITAILSDDTSGDDREYIDIELRVHGNSVGTVLLIYNADPDCEDDEWVVFFYPPAHPTDEDAPDGDVIARGNIMPLKIKRKI